MSKKFDPTYDYIQDVAEEDIKVEGDKKFIYLRGLEKLARDRGLKGTASRPVPMSAGNNFYGVMCTYTYHFEDGTYEGSADATIESCKGDFGKFLTAIAESRAKARALRAAFNISLCSVEEKGAALEDFVSAPVSKIGAHQEMLICHLREKLGISEADLIRDVIGKEVPIKSLSMDDGIALITHLNKKAGAAAKGKK